MDKIQKCMMGDGMLNRFSISQIYSKVIMLKIYAKLDEVVQYSIKSLPYYYLLFLL